MVGNTQFKIYDHSKVYINKCVLGKIAHHTAVGGCPYDPIAWHGMVRTHVVNMVLDVCNVWCHVFGKYMQNSLLKG